MNPNLSQIANEIPVVLSQYQFQRRLTPEDNPLDLDSECDFSQWIHLDKLCDDSTEEDPESRSKSDAISMPGLTSGPSEEGGSSPLPLPEDRARAKARLADAKRQDDELTIPRRELRPKGHQYPLSIHVFSAGEDSVANMTDDSRESAGNDSAFWSSPSGGNSPFTESGSSETSKPDRGRRKKPLSDRDAVAEVRELGACCNCREVCEKCIDHAQKNSGSASPLLGRQLCFRRKLSEIGLAFDRENGLAFDRFFGTSHHNVKRSCLGQLIRRQTGQQLRGLPTYSQRLMLSCRYAWIVDGISHWIWKTNTLLYYHSDFYGPLRPLPASVHRELKGIARSAMSSVERDILSGFDRFLKAGPQGRVWNDFVCELDTIDIQIQQFSNLISYEVNPVDYVLNALLKKPRKSQNQARQPKRQRVTS
ncbi:hypothetical protein DL767_007000 [Monosporascus sp. MG133]|nr:hypothetical protein DL767_007000 [Monosporascus sp. MG133]